MVKVVHVDDNGAEMAVIELDDFTIEMVYAGIASLLRDAAGIDAHSSSAPGISRATRLRREKILTRIHA